MNWTLLIQILGAASALLPQVSQLWNSSTGSTLAKIATLVKTELSSGALQELETIGAKMFPTLAKDLQAAAVLTTAAAQHSGVMSWIQAGLNEAQALGLISFGTPTGTPLAIDSIYGPKTQAALGALQAKFNLPTTGFFQDAEVAILSMVTSGGGALTTILQGILAKL